MFVIYLPLILCLVVCFIPILKAYIEYCIYLNSTYYRINRFSYRSVIKDAGRYGEYLTYKRLEKYEKDGSKFLFNIYIPKDDGAFTEIDLVLLTTRGFFVIESKNYSGCIYGNENQQKWCQTLGRYNCEKNHFFNPIIQNRYHIKHFKEHLDYYVPVYSIIVFSERCTLMDITVNSEDVYVVKRGDVYDTIRSIYDNSYDFMSETELNDIYNRLSAFNAVEETAKEQHVESVRNFINEQKTKCPRCGGRLVVRTVKNGSNAGEQFYGCSNYPNCRFKQNIKTE